MSIYSPTLSQSAQASATTGSSTTVPFQKSASAGELIMVLVSMPSTGSIYGIAGYSGPFQENVRGNPRLLLYYRLAIGSETSVTVSHDYSAAIDVFVFDNASNSPPSPVSVASGASGSASYTPAYSNSILLAAWQQDNVTPVQQTGWIDYPIFSGSAGTFDVQQRIATTVAGNPIAVTNPGFNTTAAVTFFEIPYAGPIPISIAAGSSVKATTQQAISSAAILSKSSSIPLNASARLSNRVIQSVGAGAHLLFLGSQSIASGATISEKELFALGGGATVSVKATQPIGAGARVVIPNSGNPPTIEYLIPQGANVLAVIAPPTVSGLSPTIAVRLYRGPTSLGPWIVIDTRKLSEISFVQHAWDEDPLFGISSFYYATAIDTNGVESAGSPVKTVSPPIQ